MEKSDWNQIEVTPPELEVRVIDAEGNVATAIPTYYPFEVVKKPGDDSKPWGWRGTPVFHEDGVSRWDGGWLVMTEGLVAPKIGKIIAWKLIEK